MAATRIEVLEEAKKIISTTREQEYGSPETSFMEIAEYWNLYLSQQGYLVDGTSLTRGDVAIMMALLKIARMNHFFKLDNFIDLCGYAALAAEMEED